MESGGDSKKLIVFFILIAYSISAIGDFLWIRSGKEVSPAAFITILTPSIAAAAVYFKSGKNIKVHLLTKFSIRQAVICISIPIIYFALSYIIYGVFIGNMGTLQVDIKSMITLLITFIFMGILEEAGWRGVLLPLMQQAYSDRKAVILNGLVWALWHYPMILGGLAIAYCNSVQGIITFTIEVVSMTAVIAALQKRLKMISLWPIIFIHAVHNFMSEIVVGSNGADSAIFIGDGGYIVVFFIVVLAIILVKLSCGIYCKK